MSRELHDLFQEFQYVPFPQLGKDVDGFAIYDEEAASCALRVARGKSPGARGIPVPAAEIVEIVTRLRSKSHVTDAEKEFLEYFDQMERLRAATARACGT